MSELKNKVKASLHIEFNTNCPHCEEDIDLFSDLDDVEDQAFLWGLLESTEKDAWRNIGMEFICPHCMEELTFETLEY